MSGRTWVAADIFHYDNGRLFWKISPKHGIMIGDEAGYRRKDGYWSIGFKGNQYLRHRIVYALHTGEWPDLVDHKDKIPGNDWFENLRIASKSLNGHNTNKSTGSIDFRGVSFDKRRSKYVSYFKLNRKRAYLGEYNTPEEASKAYEDYKQIHTAHLV